LDASIIADIEQFIDFDFTLGPLPSQREVIAKFYSDLATEGVITTDDNGFEFLKREFKWGLGIEANYYPTIYASYISDFLKQLSLISERSHGVSSQIDGAIEVMIHRNPDMGDGFGPGLTDTNTIFPALRALVDTPSNSIAPVRRQSYLMNYPLTAFSGEGALFQFIDYTNIFSVDLPLNVHLLSLNAINSDSKSAILRLTHIFGVGEHPTLSAPATVDLTKIFIIVKISKITETTLSGNNVLNPGQLTITLNPKDIRTFIVEF